MRRVTLHPVDPVANGKRPRERRLDTHGENCPPHSAFDPPKAMLNKAVGKKGGES